MIQAGMYKNLKFIIAFLNLVMDNHPLAPYQGWGTLLLTNEG
jgi:hypothetical protein